MRVAVWFLGVVMAGSAAAPARAGEPADAYTPPEVTWPVPLYSTHPGNGSLHLTAGLLRTGLGAGWVFSDGAALEARWEGAPGKSAVTYRTPVLEGEIYRCSAVAGTWVGALQECYLGLGFSAGLEVGLPRARVSLVWYADEGGEAYTLGIDLLHGCLDLDWAVAF